MGRSQAAVITAWQDFARPAGHAAASGELCVLKEEHGNTTIFFADPYSNTAGNAAEYLSRRLAASVFSLHLHDGAL